MGVRPMAHIVGGGFYHLIPGENITCGFPTERLMIAARDLLESQNSPESQEVLFWLRTRRLRPDHPEGRRRLLLGRRCVTELAIAPMRNTEARRRLAAGGEGLDRLADSSGNDLCSIKTARG